MSKEYNKSNIEIKAKELLLPIKASCPDNVWQEINYHLNEHTGSQRKWSGKLSATSKIVAISVVCLGGIIALIVWKFSDKIGGWSYNKSASTTLFQSKKTVIAPVKADVNPQPKPVAVNDTAHNTKPPVIKDSVKAIQNHPVVAQNVVQMPLANDNNKAIMAKRDSLLALRRNALILYRHRRDSIALASKTMRKTDSVVRVSPRILSRDSMGTAVIKTDSAGN